MPDSTQAPHIVYNSQYITEDETVERPSVCLSHGSTAACGGFAAERPVGRTYRSIAGAVVDAGSVTLSAKGRG